jgi:hypothetical protein
LFLGQAKNRLLEFPMRHAGNELSVIRRNI